MKQYHFLLAFLLVQCGNNAVKEESKISSISSSNANSAIVRSSSSLLSGQSSSFMRISSSSRYINKDSILGIVDSISVNSCFKIQWNFGRELIGEMPRQRDFYKDQNESYRIIGDAGFGDDIYLRTEIDSIIVGTIMDYPDMKISNGCDTANLLKSIELDGYISLDSIFIAKINEEMSYDEFQMWYGLVDRKYLGTDSAYYYALLANYNGFSYNEVSKDSVIIIKDYLEIYKSINLWDMRRYLAKEDIIDTINGEYIYDFSEFHYKHYVLGKISGLEVENENGTTYRLIFRKDKGIIYFTMVNLSEVIFTGKQYISTNASDLEILCKHVDKNLCI